MGLAYLRIYTTSARSPLRIWLLYSSVLQYVAAKILKNEYYSDYEIRVY
jgi:hypothetical protein